jgi:hypothetical protein
VTAHWRYLTLLPRLTLRGIDSTMVESVDHYLLRLSWSTGLTLQTLLRMTDWEENILEREYGRAGYSHLCAPDYLPELEAMTGADLRFGSFWTVRDLLGARPFGRSRHNRRWCPTCYDEWDDTQSREPLIFLVDACLICPKHRCRLEHACPSCGAHQTLKAPYEKRRICKSCDKPLGFHAPAAQIKELDAWAQHEVEALVAFCASTHSEPVDSQSFELYSRELKKQAIENGVTPLLLQQIESAGMSVRPSIRMLLNCAALQGVSVLDIIQRPMEAASRPLLDRWAEQSLLPLDMGRFRFDGLELVKLCNQLLRLSNVAFIPPLGFVLKDLRISGENFREHRVHMYREYHLRYEEQGGAAELYRQNQIFKTALTGLQGQPDSKDRALSWRLRCLVAQGLGKTSDEVAVGCNGALAYHRLSRRIKERLGVATPSFPRSRAYKVVQKDVEPVQAALQLV